MFITLMAETKARKGDGDYLRGAKMMMKIRKRGTFFLAAPFCGNFDCHPFPLFADVEGKPRPARCKRADKRHPSGPPARAKLRWTNMAGTEQRENVYVFIPNLIGSVHPCDRAEL